MANGDTAAGGLPMRIEEAEGLSHAPQRRHDQEKNYSPALKPAGGYSYTAESEREEISEEERQRMCSYIESKYNEFHERLKEKFINGDIDQKTANINIDEFNEQITKLGCNPLPYFNLPTPAFSRKY